MGDHEKTLQIKYYDINMKTKLNLTRFGSTFGTLRFDEQTFFKTFLGFTPHWVYKPASAIQADSPGLYTSEKLFEICTVDKIY